MLKSQNKTKKVIKVATFIILLCMMLDGCAKLEKKQKRPIATYMGGNNTITEICKELNAVGARQKSNIKKIMDDLFIITGLFR